MAFVHPKKLAAQDFDGHLYRLIAETIPHLVWTALPDGSADYFNRRTLEYTGVEFDALVGWAWKDIVHPEDRGHCLAAWTQSLQSGERYDVEYRLRRADGSYRWHHGTALPFHGADGRVARWFGTCTDIDGEVRSARILEEMVQERSRALRESEQRFQQFMEHLPALAWIRDSDFRYVYVNRAFARHRGVESGDMIGCTPFKFERPEAAEGIRESDRQVLAKGEPVQYFDGLPEGQWLKVKFPLRGPQGDTQIAGIAIDITDRARLEQALRDSEQRFQQFMDHLPAQAWIRDVNFRYTYVNQAFAKARGVEVDEIVGTEARPHFPKELAEGFRETDRLVRQYGARQFVEQSPTGNWLKVKFPLADATGESGVAGIAIDISARIEAEEKARRYAEDVRRLLDRLVGAQEAERRRLANDLHDLIGQNLTALGIELSAMKTGLSQESRKTATPRLDAMAGLVNDTIESIRGVMMELRPPALEEFGLVAALRSYVAVFGERTGMKVSLNVSGQNVRPPRETELALFRIVQEALTNAAKHSGGTSVEIAVTEFGGGIRLSVHDDGSGFHDRKGARGARRGGWGLPAMRERAEAHGGSLRIEFPARGTRLIVEIPGANAD